jgi:hypothetical protein
MMARTNCNLGAAAGILLVLQSTAPAALAQQVADVPDRDWYPEGYHDLRVAAAEQVETFAEPLFSYDLYNCTLGEDLPEDMDEDERELATVALQIAEYRSDFAEIGYPLEVYDQPLLDFERWLLTGDVPVWGREAAELLENPPRAYDEYSEEELTPEVLAELELFQNGMLGALNDELEQRRQRLSPRKPDFFVEGGCGAGEEPFEIKLVPANGELWLINAFAFRVCERKVPDPWNHRACGWTQYEAGDTTFASGRYMYEARWPNGSVKRGARVLQYDYNSDEGGEVTFRQD